MVSLQRVTGSQISGSATPAPGRLRDLQCDPPSVSKTTGRWMSEQIIRRAGRMVDAQSAMPWLVVAGVYVLLTALGPRLLSDPDTYSHIALGRWILEHHAVPTTDPFSATRNALGCIRVALPNCVCDGSCDRRLDWRRRADGSRGRDSFGSVDPISATRVATKCCAGRGALCALADFTAHPGAASRSSASGDGGLDRGVDPRR